MKYGYLLLLTMAFQLNAQALYFPPTDTDEWETISPEELGWCTENIDTLYNFLEAQNSNSFVVLKDGKIVLEKYFNDFNAQSTWYWASAGKTITSILVGIAQENDDLSITDKTSDYLGSGWTNCTPEEEDKITIWNQLTMTSGLDDSKGDHFCTDDTCLVCIADPGTRWAYHNGPYTLLTSVLPQATGTNLNLYVNQKLKNKTGMTGAYFQTGSNNVFYSNTRSMARFGLLMLNNGSWDLTPIIEDQSYFQQMITPSQSLNQAYGYLWWLNGYESYMLPQSQFVFDGPLMPQAPSDMYAALGANGQIINVVPSEKLVVVRMGNAPDVGEVPTNFNDDIWKLLNEIRCNTTDLPTVSKSSANEIYYDAENHILHTHLEYGNSIIRLVDHSGRIIWSDGGTNGENLFDCNLPTGLYFVQVISGSKHYSTRLWIQQ